MSDGVQTGTIETRVPARLDRLPWSRFHWRVLIGLGTVWILDGLEVTMVGAVAARLTEPGSGIAITPAQIGLAAAIYIVGACTGALFFGQLTDRFGRKKLFLITLLVYIVATVATAFAFAPWYFFLCRFFTGAGIGGEYAAINSAIDELIPARVRGRADLVINGTYWLGSAAGSALAVLLLSSLLPVNLGWRVAFGLGAVLGFVILIVRRHVPESPRWLFIHGREDEAERIVDGVEQEVVEETDQQLDEPDKSITVRQRTTIPFREIARTAFRIYPKRALLCLALFVGQAFIYNGITFNLGTLVTGYYGVAAGFAPVFLIVYAVGNFLGPVTLGRLFDTVGRKAMISGTYLGSALLAIVLTWVFYSQFGGQWVFLAALVATFFVASAGASAAYLTVSEIFPMETRALAIAFFYALGTGLGGIVGPLLFGSFIDSGSRGLVAIGFLVAAGVMALGGVAELVFGVRAEQSALEDIAQPLTADEGGQEGPDQDGPDQDGAGQDGPGQEGAGQDGAEKDGAGTEVSRLREEAEYTRAAAAEHRAAAAAARTGGRDGRVDDDRVRTEEALAEIGDLRAAELDAIADARELLRSDGRDDGSTALLEARVGEQRARSLSERQAAVGAADEETARRHAELADAAAARADAARARVRAVQERGTAEDERAAGDGAAEERCRTLAGRFDAEAQAHDARSAWFRARAAGDSEAVAEAEAEAERAEREADAARERAAAAEHRERGAGFAGETAEEERAAQERAEAAERRARERDAEQRIRERIEARRSRDRRGPRRWRPGPSASLSGARFGGTPFDRETEAQRALDREIAAIGRALADRGTTSRAELGELVGARYWGPGRFPAALRVAVDEGVARRVGRNAFAPGDTT
ncbi:MFS transporter [Pseudonocardia sp. RS010]|uniref:MFS transporter n=1 Tax=Pseudonocardia sp. RS010 TaxID=3385979 RepID=UPI0039A3A172